MSWLTPTKPPKPITIEEILKRQSDAFLARLRKYHTLQEASVSYALDGPAKRFQPEPTHSGMSSSADW